MGGNGTGVGAFAIDDTGKITVNDRAQVDFEAVVDHQFVLVITARDSLFDLSTTQTVIVKLVNVHEGTVLLPGDLLITGIDGDDNDEFSLFASRPRRTNGDSIHRCGLAFRRWLSHG